MESRTGFQRSEPGPKRVFRACGTKLGGGMGGVTLTKNDPPPPGVSITL